MNPIQEQYGQFSAAEVDHGGNRSPVGSATSSNDHNMDNELVKKLQQQINVLQREVRRLHNRHRELHSELVRLRQQNQK